jgi:hypothetical protein
VSRLVTEVEIGPFDYEWEQRAYDAASRVLDCRMHFDVPDEASGGVLELRDAFTYRFRLWGVDELRELLLQAGFADAQLWRHTYDAAKGEQGVFLGPVEAIADEDRWTAYVVALR